MKFRYLYQLLLSHTSVLIIAFMILGLLFSQYVENLVYENKVTELRSYGEKILSDLERPSPRRPLYLEEYSSLLHARNIDVITFNRQGEVSFSRGGVYPRIELSKEEWQKIERGETVPLKKDFGRFDQAVSLVIMPRIINDQLAGGLILIAPISGSREMLSEINKYLLYIVLLSLAISLLISLFLSKLHVKRIQRIRDATSRVSSGHYDVHVPSSNFDEIGDLAEDFNEMVTKLRASKEEIDSLENRRRQFMADVSHELRTPLTTIRGVIEGIRNDMIPEEQKEKSFGLVSEETRRLIRLVNENLDYEKIRSNQVAITKVTLPLLDIFEVIKEQLDLQAEEKGNEIRVVADSGATVHADYDRLIQILINITKNSIQFTSGGTITLRGSSSGTETVIEIEDTGIGMDPEEIQSIWRRFYKADLSRTNNPYGEFGIGLSIVKQLVLMHEGTIDVFSEKGKGTKFVIRLPL
ncbi:HAMP domain-containing histidine kinase [Bacillus sp. CH30_1T]|uniref:sensor histidine kinase n=1 Tax=Bacillus sp. CH30_1T TaxID=2604836 RepID=UPI0011EEFE19|nr:HAMP domain-containing sensor histidine kinase [Bacillus sp. CH30_1T]KAA0560425.1 HAMP domain-containing histidine kinase [Bacillus sp. CH30_1T]